MFGDIRASIQLKCCHLKKMPDQLVLCKRLIIMLLCDLLLGDCIQLVCLASDNIFHKSLHSPGKKQMTSEPDGVLDPIRGPGLTHLNIVRQIHLIQSAAFYHSCGRPR